MQKGTLNYCNTCRLWWFGSKTAEYKCSTAYSTRCRDVSTLVLPIPVCAQSAQRVEGAAVKVVFGFVSVRCHMQGMRAAPPLPPVLRTAGCSLKVRQQNTGLVFNFLFVSFSQTKQQLF